MSKILSAIIIAVFVFFLFPQNIQAATLNLSKIPQPYVNQTFDVTVFADSEGQGINSAEANLEYSDTLELISVSQGSAFFIATPPSPFNEPGKVYFSGGLPTPGYNGKQGALGTMKFKAKSDGNAWIRFTRGRVFLNDGLGTNVLNQTSDLNFTIVNDVTPPNVFDIRLVGENDVNNASTTPTIAFETADGQSGIDHYEIFAGKELSSSQTENTFSFPKQIPGALLIKVIAFDKAGNSISSEMALNIVLPVEQLPPQIISSTEFKKITGPLYGLMAVNALLGIAVFWLIYDRRKEKKKAYAHERKMITEINNLMRSEFVSFDAKMRQSIQEEMAKLEQKLSDKRVNPEKIQERLEILRRFEDQITQSNYTNWRSRKNPDNM